MAINTRTAVVPRDAVRPLLDTVEATSIAAASEPAIIENLNAGDRERHAHFE